MDDKDYEKKYNITKEWLKEQYENKSILKIAEEKNITRTTLYRIADSFGIKMRDHSEDKRGELNYKWKGSKYENTRGYSMIRNDNGCILEHRDIIEKNLGRELKSEEVIHHINFIRNDNRLDNLFLCENRKEHNDITKSIFQLINDLLKKEIIVFNKVEKKYQYNER